MQTPEVTWEYWSVSNQEMIPHQNLTCCQPDGEHQLPEPDQALSLWSGSTDSKTLDYQRTDPQFSSVQSLSHVQFFATPWTAAYQAPLCMGFSRQEYWSGLPFPSPGDLPDPRIKPGSPALQTGALPSEPSGTKLRRAETKRKKEFNLEGWEKETSNSIS